MVHHTDTVDDSSSWHNGQENGIQWLSGSSYWLVLMDNHTLL